MAVATGPAGWSVPLTIDDQSAALLLDTGAERSMLFEDAAARLGVRRDEWAAANTRGVGGDVRQRLAVPRSVSLGGVELRRRSIARDATMVVGPAMAGAGDGLLGQDLLSGFDVELDPQARVLRLWTATACAEGVRPPGWPAQLVTLPTTRPFRNVLLVAVQLDGRVLGAEIDTGAAVSVVTGPGMAQLRITPADLAGAASAPAAGIGPKTAVLRARRFAAFAVEGEAARPTTLWVAPIRTPRSIDMLLGRDWIGGRRLWWSYGSSRIVVETTTADPSFGN